ncbi:hypothetical protein FKM82_023924 [Ascaphus truei]
MDSRMGDLRNHYVGHKEVVYPAVTVVWVGVKCVFPFSWVLLAPDIDQTIGSEASDPGSSTLRIFLSARGASVCVRVECVVKVPS